TGLDLESFLLLLRADLSAWVILGLGSVGLAVLVWSCRGSRRSLRRCLGLSLSAHVGLVLYGSTIPAVQLAGRGEMIDAAKGSHIRRIRVAPLAESGRPRGQDVIGTRSRVAATGGARSGGVEPRLELADAPIRLADATLRVARAEVATAAGSEPEPK